MIWSKRVSTLYIRDDALNLLVTKGKRVEKWATLPLEPGLVRQGLVLNEARVADELKKLFKLVKISKRKVIVGLTGLDSIYRLISLPRLPKGVIAEAIQHEAQRVITTPLSEVYFTYQLLPPSPGETRFFLVAFPRNVLDTLVRTLRQAGIRPYIVDTAPLAVCRTLDQDKAIIVHTRLDHLDFIVMEDRIPQLIRRVVLPTEVSTLAERLPTIIEEVDRTITFYNSSHKEKPLDATMPMFVSGDLVEAPQSWPRLGSKLNCSVSILPSPLEFSGAFDPNEFIVNIGLAMKEVWTEKKGAHFSLVNFNVLPQVYQHPPVHLTSILAPVGSVALVGLLIYMILLVRNTADENSALRRDLTSAQNLVSTAQGNIGTLPQQVADAEGSIAPAQARTAEFSNTLRSLEDGRGIVDGELPKIFAPLPASIELTAVSYRGESVAVTGICESPDEDIIWTYARALSTPFPNVRISSIAATVDKNTGLVTGYSFQLVLK